MNTELKTLILKRIRSESLGAFSCYDFLDLANYKTVSKCLERMEDNQEIKRVIPGIYCLTRTDEVLSLELLPSINEVANSLARKHKWFICPTGNAALNIMGLSTQVPANYVFLSNGPYKQYSIYGIDVSFKRTMNRELSDYTYKSLLLIQCIKAIGKDKISDAETNILRTKLSKEEKETIFKETTMVPIWIRDVIVSICKE